MAKKVKIKSKRNRPQWRIHALDKITRETTRIGSAWNKRDGSISIAINPWTLVPTGPNIIITMFPIGDDDE